jgi:uncharacterized protein YndB with AHSA1/START domain
VGEEPAKPIELSIWIAARPETVFAFLIDPQKLVQWLGVAADLEPRRGGSFRVDMNGRDVVRGHYLDVSPPSRVVFTWGWESGEGRIAAGSTTVEITLAPSDSGTLLRLQHSGLPAPDREAHARGWQHYAERLKARAEGRDPGPDAFAAPEHRHTNPDS